MLNVYLLRHGETPWNADGNRYCGRTDVPLTEKGLGQARAVEEQLRNVALDAIYSSPLQRAWHTAKIAGGGREVVLEPRLIEADFGGWEKKRKEEFIPENTALWADWCRDPATTRAGGTGETAMEVILRVHDFFEEAVRRHASGNILVVAHNGVNRFYLAWKLGMPLRHYRRLVQENSSVTMFSLDVEGELTLQLLNARVVAGGYEPAGQGW